MDDPDGFFSIEKLRARAKSAPSPADFARGCPGPALLITEDAKKGDGGPKEKPGGSSSFLIVTLEGKATGTSGVTRYLKRAAFIAKRPGNPFPNMVSLGRATSNDIVIALETVSKLHGYFLREGDQWFYTDYQSTNGTIINDQRVERSEKRLLADGDRFQIGLDVKGQFLSPVSLYERVRGGPA